MAKGRHKISKDKAKACVSDFKKRKKDHPDELKGLPEGFLFDAEDVINLLKPAETRYFVIKFGWKKTKMSDGTEREMVAPILMVLNEKYEVIHPNGTDKMATTRSLELRDDDEGGGFLDEADPIPPPVNNF